MKHWEVAQLIEVCIDLIELQLNLKMKHVVELMYQEVVLLIERQVELMYQELV